MRGWRRHWVTLVLCLGALGLGLYVYVFDAGRVTTGEQLARKRNIWKAYRRDQIDLLEVRRPGEHYRLVRAPEATDDLFRLELEGAPWGAEPLLADQVAVAKLLADLEFAVAERYLERVSAPPATEPLVSLRLRMGKLDQVLTIDRAQAPAPPQAHYARLDGEPLVVARELFAQIDQPAVTYRSKTVVPYSSSELAEIQIEHGGQTQRFLHDAIGFRVASEPRARVDRAAFDRVLVGLADMRAERFLEGEGSARSLLGNTPVTLTLVPRSPSQVRAQILVGQPCEQGKPEVAILRIAPLPIVAACAPRVTDLVEAQEIALRDRHLFTLRPDEVVEVRLTEGPNRIDLARAGTGFRLREPHEGTVDESAGNQLIRDLTQCTGVDLLPHAPHVFRARGTVRLISAAADDDLADGSHADASGNGGGEIIEWGPEPDSGAILAHRLQDDVYLSLPQGDEALLTASLVRLRPARVLDIPLLDIRALTVRSPHTEQRLQHDDGGWRYEQPAGFAVDATLANDLAELTGRLRADRWLDSSAYPKEAPPSTTVTLTYVRPAGEWDAAAASSQEQSVTLDVVATTGGASVARIRDRDGAFLLPRSVLAALDSWLLDRSPLTQDPASFGSVVLRHGRTSLRFDRRGKQLVREGADAAEGTALQNALDGLRPEVAVHPGAARPTEGFDDPTLELIVETDVALASDASPSAARAHSFRIRVGKSDVHRNVPVYYVRRSDLDATFVVAQSLIQPMLALLERAHKPTAPR